MLGNQRQYQVDVAASLERFRDGLDRSTAMSLIRSLTGRTLQLADHRPFPPALTGDEIAYRIRLPGASRPVVETGERLVVSEPAVASAAVQAVHPDDSPAPETVVEPLDRHATGPSDLSGEVVRTRLLRDTTAMVTGLAGIVALVLAVWPMTPGGVLDATGTPGPNAAVLVPVTAGQSPGTVAPQASLVPDASAGSPIAPAATVVPAEDDPVQGPAPTNRPQPRAAQPVVGPAPKSPTAPAPSSNPAVPPPVIGPPSPTPRPVVTPSPTGEPPPPATPTPATPTPEPTPATTPTADPTPDPTPEPTPDPTPEPTPDPTPDPTPEPTPEPTPDL